MVSVVGINWILIRVSCRVVLEGHPFLVLVWKFQKCHGVRCMMGWECDLRCFYDNDLVIS